jgi:GDP-L-fucose synthase
MNSYGRIGKDSKILVTGGRGMLGSQFIGEDYIKKGSNEIDLLDSNAIDNFLSTENIEGVIHCAARVGGIMGNMKNPASYLHDNLIMNTHIIESARKYNIPKLIFFSSTCVFPNDVEYPLTPNKVHLGPPHQSNYGYAYAKRIGQIQIEAYKEQYGLNYFSIIPSNMYGPNDMYNIEDGHVIPSLIHKVYLADRNKEDLVIWGSGNPLREFVFSRDMAKLTEILYREYNGSEPIIISGDEISIGDLVSKITEIYGFRGKVRFDSSKPDGQHRKPSDNSVIKNLIPDFKYTSLEDGLTESINWFIDNYENARK